VDSTKAYVLASQAVACPKSGQSEVGTLGRSSLFLPALLHLRLNRGTESAQFFALFPAVTLASSGAHGNTLNQPPQRRRGMMGMSGAKTWLPYEKDLPLEHYYRKLVGKLRLVAS